MNQTIFLPKKMNLVITSFGGCATTTLLRYFSTLYNTNSISDQDGLKHLPFPPISFNKNLKFIYLYGDPRQTVASIFRRNFQHVHSIKLQQGMKVTSTKSYVPSSDSIEKYASNGIDNFHLQNHFQNWYYNYTSFHPTLFIRYESLWQNIDAISNFLNIPMDLLDNFPEKKERQSELSETAIKGLNQIYGDFHSKLLKLNDVEIKQSKKYSAVKKYFKYPYTKTILSNLKNRLPR